MNCMYTLRESQNEQIIAMYAHVYRWRAVLNGTQREPCVCSCI